MMDPELKSEKLKQLRCSGCNQLADGTEILDNFDNQNLGPLVNHIEEEVYHIQNQLRSL